jgi:DNA modification methylase
MPNYKPPKVVRKDNRNTAFPNDSFDIVFSHPPYGTMVNYFSISRVQLSILDAIKFRSNTIGLDDRDLINSTKTFDQSSGTRAKFLHAIPIWIAEAHRVLRRGGSLICVIGDGRDEGYLFHPHTHVIAAAEALGMRVKELFVWVTENKSGMHVKRKGHHIDHNYVVVLKKI